MKGRFVRLAEQGRPTVSLKVDGAPVEAQARVVVARARENAARLSGQLEAVQAQNTALLETLRGKVAGNG